MLLDLILSIAKSENPISLMVLIPRNSDHFWYSANLTLMTEYLPLLLTKPKSIMSYLS